MREIKFRVARYGVRELIKVYDDVTGIDYDEEFEVYNARLKKGKWIINVIPLQFTGLKDANGVEIYEGDIMTMIIFEDNAEYLGYVVFENGCFCLNISLDGTKYKVPAWEWKETETIITVIGNIYENPELLEREAE